MHSSPSDELIDLLGRLKLASPREVRAARRHARRLAHDLPLFDSVWVDALVQARRLTAFQASQINSGCGEPLRVGPYVILAPLPAPPYAECYRARDIEHGREVRLTVLPCEADASAALAALGASMRAARLIDEASSTLLNPQHSAGECSSAATQHRGTPAARIASRASDHLIPIERCGAESGRLWAAGPLSAGRTAAEWLINAGRMPPPVVLEIARQMCATLAACETAGFVHGDISTASLVLDPMGHVRLLDAGLRSAVRPTDDDSQSALPAEAYDYLAPERVRSAAPPSIAADIFACGAVWWHLLAGRSPRAGATADMRRAAAQARPLRDIYPIASDAPRVLIEAIRLCTKADVERRPASFAALVERLGPPRERGQARLADFVARGASPPERLVRRVRTMRRSPHAPTWVAAAGGILLAALVGVWPLWRSLVTVPRPVDRAPLASPTDAPSSSAPANREQSPRREIAHGSAPRATPPTQSKMAIQATGAVDRTADIALTSATEPLPPRTNARGASREFVISGAQPTAWSELRPGAGQVVCARPGERALVTLPVTGATLSVENVRFVDIDFVAPRTAGNGSAALRVTARHIAFERCTFQGFAPTNRPQTMLDWTPAATDPAAGGDAARTLEMAHCVIGMVGAGLHCRASSDATLSLGEVLFTGTGPLLWIDGAGEGRSAVNLQLRHCTVRGAACVVELAGGNRSQGPAEESPLHVEADACVLAPLRDGPVILLHTAQASGSLQSAVTWRGEGSVVTPATPIVQSLADDGHRRAVADGRLSIEGLVRTELGFAGEIDDGPDASRLVRWQVPLRSTEPPGIGDGRLPPPRPLAAAQAAHPL